VRSSEDLSVAVAGQRRKKLALIAETMEPGMTVSLVARRH
jgi:hypothetical protein